MMQNPEELLPLTFAVFHILASLADADRHGYGIIQDVEVQTNGKLRLAPGTLYGAVNRLLNQKLIEESDSRPDASDQRRKYYRLTNFGRKVLVAEIRRLQALVAIAHAKNILSAEG